MTAQDSGEKGLAAPRPQRPPQASGDAYPKSDYKEYPKTLPPDDFWGQVRRTIHGRRVTDDEVQLIIGAIEVGLDLQPGDVVLDLACGNAALSRHLFGACRGLIGVDFSEYLIEVAKANFELLPYYRFEVDDAAHFVQHAQHPERFTKVLCYGSFSFFSQTDAGSVLGSLFRRFPNVARVFLGNLPDKARASEFYGTELNPAVLSDPTAQIGIWRTVREISTLAGQYGWETTISHMPEGFFNASYRYDVVLHRPA